jgi:hypothetical protein
MAGWTFPVRSRLTGSQLARGSVTASDLVRLVIHSSSILFEGSRDGRTKIGGEVAHRQGDDFLGCGCLAENIVGERMLLQAEWAAMV